jgi:hypothetical protein
MLSKVRAAGASARAGARFQSPKKKASPEASLCRSEAARFLPSCTLYAPLGLNASGIHRVEELGVALGLPELVEQELDRVDGSHRV